MAKEDIFWFLSQSDWRELIAPLVVFGVYILVSALKSIGSKVADQIEEQSEPEPSTGSDATGSNDSRPQLAEIDQVILQRRQERLRRQQTHQPAVRSVLTASPSASVQMPPRRPSAPSAADAAKPAAVKRKKQVQTGAGKSVAMSEKTAPRPTYLTSANATKAYAISAAPRPVMVSEPVGKISEKLKNRQSLRQAVILAEILGKPLALRENDWLGRDF